MTASEHLGRLGLMLAVAGTLLFAKEAGAPVGLGLAVWAGFYANELDRWARARRVGQRDTGGDSAGRGADPRGTEGHHHDP